ncbi:DUF7504 family protein [Methanoplanus limicola]|uniref:KaiC-like domain-containing protein n=1 Tax=Methanoplanus limicola DSM 2279 TaxID=937775 RepID=H1Z3D4_9EURY|nr:hypothetical protein [Methanoplanus limicola]EHQ36549.1 hypothetical protein Metlim_2503 [Methanoplanus limicola DSM 2279]
MPVIAEALSESDVIIAMAEAGTLRKNVITNISELCSLGFAGIVISINEPWLIMNKALSKNGTDTSKLFFIDCITITAVGQKKDENNCIYINSPGQLTNIGIALTRAMGGIKDKENLFLMIDSVNTMFVYNDSTQIIRFLHMFANKARLNSLKGIMFSVKNAVDPVISAQLATFADETVDLDADE